MAADLSQRKDAQRRASHPTSGGFELSRSVRSLLGRVRGLIRRRIALDGLLLAILCVLSVYWFGALIDYLPVKVGSNETPRWVRAALLILMGLGVAWAICWRLGGRLLTRLSDRSLALLIERRFPQLNNELVTVVELASKPADDVSNPSAYRQMLHRVHDSVSQRVMELEPRGLLNWKPVWALAWATGALLVWTLAVAVANPSWLAQWSSRLFALSDEGWPRLASLRAEGVQIQLPTFTGQLSADRLMIPFKENVVHVPRGGSVVLQVLADTSARQVPELCTLFYQLADGSRGRANMRRLGGSNTEWQPFMLDGPPLVDLDDDVSFDVVGGDARLDNYRIQVVDPAVVTNMRLDVTYPSYLLSSRSGLPPREQLEFRNGQRIAEGTNVVLKGTASGPLTTVQYIVRTVQSSRRTNTPKPAATAKNEKQPASIVANSDKGSALTLSQGPTSESDVQILSVTPNGSQFEIPLGILRDTLAVEIRLIDEFGLANEQIPRYLITVLEDTQPEVESKLVGIGSAVTPKAVLPIVGTARDDHALERVWTTIIVNENPPLEIETPVEADGKLEPKIDLLELAEQRDFQVAPDSTLGLVVSATDRFDLDGVKHTGSGQPFQLAVVTEDKLLVLLDRQELELRQRLELIISELTQLRDVLREIGRVDGPTTGASTSTSSTARQPVNRQPFVLPGSMLAQNVALLQSGNAATEPRAADEKDEQEDDDSLQPGRLNLLRAQQSVLQADKSQQELVGVASRVEDVRLQLINNRIDSIDRQARLHDRVFLPLQSVLASEMEEFRNRLAQFQSASMSPTGGTQQAAAAADANDRVLVALDAIIANMLDLETYNEIIDLVRGILEDEERLLEETQKKQKQDILNSLK